MTQFRILRVFNDPSLRALANSKSKVGQNTLPHFSGEGLVDRLMRELAHERALPLKEITEAFEFFALTRKFLGTSKSVVDLCCGHGLAGILFAVFERKVEQVLLFDKQQPVSFDALWRACLQAAPWIEAKVRYVEGSLAQARGHFPRSSALLSVHACGKLTDACIELGLGCGGPLAVMPCCRAQAQNPAPAGLRQALGDDVACDVERTYAMERRGYRVRWREIPAAITPMNRVLIGVPPVQAKPQLGLDSRDAS